MRTLSRFRINNKTEVKFLQSALNLHGADLSIDGGFGPKTENAVREFQATHQLTVDGSAGPQTQMALGFLATKNKNIVAFEIPFDNIRNARVLWKDGEKYSCQKFAQQGFNVVWNGAFFNMDNLKVVQLLVINGQVQTWGFGYEGIVYPRQFGRAWSASCFDLNGLNVDMQGSAPTLIDQYVTDHASIATFSKSILSAKTRRNCTGITDKSIVLMFSIANMTLYDMRDEGLNLKLKFLQGNDGGGSQSLYMGGGYVITTDGRAIPAAVGLEVKYD